MDAKLPVKLQFNSQVAKTHKDEKKSEKVKDRGDLRKGNISRANREAVQPVKGFMSDRGDSQRDSNGQPSQRTHAKPTINKKPEDAKKVLENDVKIIEIAEQVTDGPKKVPADAYKRTIEARKCDVLKKDTSKKYEGQVQNRLALDLEGKKRLREMYTLKLKKNQNLSKVNYKVESKECAQIEKRADPNVFEKKETDDKLKSVTSDKSSKASYTERKQTLKPAKDTCGLKKPIIKTYSLKNDNRVYKAVSFVQEKQQTPLQIRIPSDYKKKHERERSSESSQHNEHTITCDTLVEELPVEFKHNLKTVKRAKRKKGRILSSELCKSRASTPTEVARWVPSCVNHQTKPYYEAWVDTTLAAISKFTKTDKFIEKNLVQTVQSALRKRSESPDLVYEDYNDVRYTGIIKVRRR